VAAVVREGSGGKLGTHPTGGPHMSVIERRGEKMKRVLRVGWLLLGRLGRPGLAQLGYSTLFFFFKTFFLFIFCFQQCFSTNKQMWPK
jgi:hypothetical protein